MKKKNTGKPFERLTKQVFDVLTADERLTSVEMDVELDGLDGPRQIDVLLESKVAGFSIRTVIEARDYNKRLDITHVDGLHSKMNDVKANKAVLVSRRGFSKGATKKANRLGITLCTLNNPDSELAGIGLEIPILLLDIYDIKLDLSCAFQLNKGDVVPHDVLKYINDTPIIDYVHTALIDGKIKGLDDRPYTDWTPDIPQPHFVRLSAEAGKLEIKDLSIRLTPSIKFLFGYLSEVNGSVIYQNLTDKQDCIILPRLDIATLRPQLTEFNTIEDIPAVSSTLKVTGVIAPTFRKEHEQTFTPQKIEKIADNYSDYASWKLKKNAG